MGVFDYIKEGYNEAKSYLPGQAAYDARNPSSPVYNEPKQFGGLTYTETRGGSFTPNAVQPSAGGGGGGASAVAPDPYAKYGGRAAFDQLNASFNNQKNAIYSTAGQAGDTAARGYQGSILDFLDQQRLGQQSIEDKAVQNELKRTQGRQDVMDSVGKGLRNISTMVSGRNIGNSTAAGQLAKLEARQGEKQLSGVNNQYETGNIDISREQDVYNTNRNSGLRKLQDKDSIIGDIVVQARGALSQLDAARANASLTDRIAIDQEAEAIRQQALGKLSQFDATLNSGIGGIQAGSTEGRRGEAARRFSLGQGPTESFEYDTDFAPDIQDTLGTSDLPLFTFNKRRQGA